MGISGKLTQNRPEVKEQSRKQALKQLEDPNSNFGAVWGRG
jgi:hypothetical protein